MTRFFLILNMALTPNEIRSFPPERLCLDIVRLLRSCDLEELPKDSVVAK